MNNWRDYIPHVHHIVWILLACILLYRLNDTFTFIKETLSEPKADGTPGKGSQKRLVIFLFASTFVYLCIYSIHAKIELDKYLMTLIVIFILLALRIMMPEQANSFMDKLKAFTNFKVPEPEVRAPEQKDKVTVNTTTEVNT